MIEGYLGVENIKYFVNDNTEVFTSPDEIGISLIKLNVLDDDEYTLVVNNMVCCFHYNVRGVELDHSENTFIVYGANKNDTSYQSKIVELIRINYYNNKSIITQDEEKRILYLDVEPIKENENDTNLYPSISSVKIVHDKNMYHAYIYAYLNEQSTDEFLLDRISETTFHLITSKISVIQSIIEKSQNRDIVNSNYIFDPVQKCLYGIVGFDLKKASFIIREFTEVEECNKLFGILQALEYKSVQNNIAYPLECISNDTLIVYVDEDKDIVKTLNVLIEDIEIVKDIIAVLSDDNYKIVISKLQTISGIVKSDLSEFEIDLLEDCMIQIRNAYINFKNNEIFETYPNIVIILGGEIYRLDSKLDNLYNNVLDVATNIVQSNVLFRNRNIDK